MAHVEIIEAIHLARKSGHLRGRVGWIRGELSGCSVDLNDCPAAEVDSKYCYTPGWLCDAAFDCSAFAYAKPSTTDPKRCRCWLHRCAH